MGELRHKRNYHNNDMYWDRAISVVPDQMLFVCVCVEVLRPSQPNGVMSSAKLTRSDAVECGIWSGSILFATHPAVLRHCLF